ncbi:hypothetical protein RAC69_05075 [Microbacterium sp. LS_15]|uniref:hypothetical protein n=1 Tax=Microbacterium sp. LS_15 TaxID=3055790 RepID=UPI0035C11570
MPFIGHGSGEASGAAEETASAHICSIQSTLAQSMNPMATPVNPLTGARGPT